MIDPELERRLNGLRRRTLALGGTSGAAWGLTAALVALPVAMWLDLIWELPPALRITAWVVAGAAAVAITVITFARAQRQAAAGRLADRLDAAGNTSGTIRAGWELTQTDKFESPLSQGLALIAVEKAKRASAAIDDRRVMPLGVLRRAMGSCGALLALLLLVAVVLPNVARTEWLRFTRPFDDVTPFSPITIHVEPGDASVVYGSGLEIRVRTEGPSVDEIELVMIADGSGSERPTEESLPMFPDDDGSRRASLTSIKNSTTYYVRADTARSSKFRINVVTVPKLEDVSVRITPPAYTRTSPYQGPVPQDGIVGLAGTEVEFTAASNRPLSVGTLEITVAGPEGKRRESVALAPRSAGDSEVVGKCMLAGSGTFALSVVDVAGQRSQESFGGAITVVDDERPFIRMLQPREQSLAVPDATVPIEWSAEDDYGVTKLKLFRSLNDSAWHALDLPVTLPPQRRADGGTALPFSTFGLSPGDEIKLFMRVEDNDPRGAKGTESNVCLIRIISHEQFEQMMRTRHTLEMLASKYRQAQRRLESLAKKREELNKKLQDSLDQEKKGLKKKTKDKPGESPVDDELKKDLAAMQDQLARDIAELRKAAASNSPYDLDKSLSKHLEDHIKRLESMSDRVQRLAKKKDLTDNELAQALKEMAGDMQQADLEVEQKMMEPIEHLELVFPLIASESKFEELVRRQRLLAERIASLKADKKDDPANKARMREMQEEQAQLRDDLDRLLGDIESQAERLPDDEKFKELKESAKEFVEAARKLNIGDDMAEAETALAGFQVKEAGLKADSAADKLESLLSKSQAMQGKGGACLKFSPGLSSSLGNTIAQLLGDMGLGDGMGGSGSGGGRSASRGGNVGLYGDMPAMAGGDGGSDVTNRPDESTAPGYARDGKRANREKIATGAASGSETGEVVEIPLPYRRRVADYFRRLSEDLD